MTFNEIEYAYRRRMTAWSILFAFLSIIFCVQRVSAQAPPYIIQHNGVQVFDANVLQHQAQSPIWNFCDSAAQCANTPPVNPPNDPNALTNILGKITNMTCPLYSTSTGQNFASVFGLGYNPPATTWPYAPSTSVSMTLPPHGRYYGGVISPGLNPGILPHYLKINGYAGSCVPPLQTPANARFDARVVPVGNTPAPVGRCAVTNAAPDNTPLVQLKFAGPINSAHCLGAISPTNLYRYIVENTGTTNVTILLTYN